jgi:hypothetical protein
MHNDNQVNYDALCYATMINVKTKSAGADRIVFRNFHYGNKEHQFVLAVTMACWNILGEREVAIDDNMFSRAMLNKRYGKTCKIGKAKKTEEIFVDVEELLEFMRGPACEVCGNEFTFGDIYDAYYDRKDKR